MSKGHLHVTEEGKLIACYHQCKNTLSSPAFYLGVTLSFPLEHYLWEHVWPFTIVTKLMGL